MNEASEPNPQVPPGDLWSKHDTYKPPGRIWGAYIRYTRLMIIVSTIAMGLTLPLILLPFGLRRGDLQPLLIGAVVVAAVIVWAGSRFLVRRRGRGTAVASGTLAVVVAVAIVGVVVALGGER